MKKLAMLPILLLALGVVSCGSSDDSNTDTTQDLVWDSCAEIPDSPDAMDDLRPQDSSPDIEEDQGIVDMVSDEQGDETVEDTQDAKPDQSSGEYGFDWRIPESHSLECVGGFMGDTVEDFMDTDWLCTFEHGGVSGFLYLQATPTQCETMMSSIPVYTEVQAFLSVDNVVSKLDNASYDWGGNHNNDELGFDYEGHHYRYYHSSFGWGWRKCLPMDCVEVYDAAGTTLEEAGCESDRSLPVVCVPIQADGTHEALVDTFEKCPGDDS